MKTISFLLLLLFCGCAMTSADLAKVSIGMNRPQVIKALGSPHGVAANGSREFLTYNLDVENMGGKREYYVLLVNGVVQSYGQKGDFDTLQKTKERIDLNVTK